LALVPAKIDFVSGVNQKRVWDHITNADHAQVSINFKGGVQATFINSDLAAARKPKYYLLGTKGALVGNWDESGAGAVADRSAIITLHLSDGSSKVLPPVDAQPFAFHRSVANYLNNQVPMDVQAGQSRDVVAILQAAELSALSNGLPVTPVLLSR
jgi:hypothetical protein